MSFMAHLRVANWRQQSFIVRIVQDDKVMESADITANGYITLEFPDFGPKAYLRIDVVRSGVVRAWRDLALTETDENFCDVSDEGGGHNGVQWNIILTDVQDVMDEDEDEEKNFTLIRLRITQ